MVTTASTVLVPAPVEEVWDLLAAFADISWWADNVSQSSLLTDGPIGLGSVRRVQVGRSALRETITTWEPGRALGYRIAGLPAIVHEAGNVWTLETQGEGTAVTLTGTAAVRGGPLLGRVVGRQLGKEGGVLLDSLRRHLTNQQEER